MDVEILARFQFALTIMFHYIYPPLSIGLGLQMVIMEGLYMKTKKALYLQMAKFWTRVFAVTFAVGVATGIVMEFEFGTNWASYSKYVGDVFGSALAAEGIFAFFLESGFLALLLFGWNRLSPKVHYFSTIMVCLGAHFSAVWIVVANSWMQTPAGFHIVGEGLAARAEIVDFWAMVLNPSSVVRLSHVIVGCWLAGAFLVISVAAYYLLKQRHRDFAKSSMKTGLAVAAVAIVLQIVVGHISGEVVARYQPLKLAAMEAVYKTTSHASMSLFGLPNSKTQTIDYNVAIPGFLSLAAFDNADAEVKGLDQFPEKDWPHVFSVYMVYHIMVLTGVLMLIFAAIGLYKWRRGSLFESRLFLKCAIFSVLLPQIGNQAGWVAAEMGRYPWIVYDLLRISDGLSKSVTANQAFGSILMFGFVYLFLFVMFLYLLNEKIKHGPLDEDHEQPYHHLQAYVKGTENE